MTVSDFEVIGCDLYSLLWWYRFNRAIAPNDIIVIHTKITETTQACVERIPSARFGSTGERGPIGVRRRGDPRADCDAQRSGCRAVRVPCRPPRLRPVR